MNKKALDKGCPCVRETEQSTELHTHNPILHAHMSTGTTTGVTWKGGAWTPPGYPHQSAPHSTFLMTRDGRRRKAWQHLP